MADKLIPIKWQATIDSKGKPHIKNKDEFDRHLELYAGQEVQIVIKKKRKERSPQEHKYYWAVVVRMVAEEMSLMPEEAHDLMKDILLKVPERGVTEHGVPYAYWKVKSITELNDIQFREYWQACQRWASQPTDPEGGLGINSGLGLYIPDPNEVDYSDY